MPAKPAHRMHTASYLYMHSHRFDSECLGQTERVRDGVGVRTIRSAGLARVPVARHGTVAEAAAVAASVAHSAAAPESFGLLGRAAARSDPAARPHLFYNRVYILCVPLQDRARPGGLTHGLMLQQYHGHRLLSLALMLQRIP